MEDVKLTKNFRLKEMLVSDSFPDIASKMQPTQQDVERLTLLCEGLLQKVRDRFGPVKVISGLRRDGLNELVDGWKDSDHTFATAADIEVREDIMIVFKWIIGHNLHFRQVIAYPEQNFIHVSINLPGRPYKNDRFVKRDGKYNVW